MKKGFPVCADGESFLVSFQFLALFLRGGAASGQCRTIHG